MAEKEYKIFKVDMDRELMQDIIEVFEHYRLQPCRKNVMWELPDRLRKILQHGCFKHNILTERFEINSTTSRWVCPKCSPKEYKKLKQIEVSGNSAHN